MTRRAIALSIVCAACGTTAGGSSTVKKEPAPPPTVVASQKKIETPPPEPMIKKLEPQPFTPNGAKPTELFAIEGALVVVEGQRVSRIVGDGLEPIGKIPKETPAFGENNIVSVVGRYPDAVGALYITSQGRAPAPTYVTLTGKTISHTEAGGGGWGELYVARIGDSILVAGASNFDGHRLLTVRGPKVARAFTPAKDVCKPSEAPPGGPIPGDVPPAMNPSAFESTTAGTLVSLGTLCTKRGPAAEIWDKTTGKPRIADLGAWWKKVSYRAQLLKSSGDELFAYTSEFEPMLRFADGTFTPLPTLASPPANVFVSPSGQLHALASNRIIYRLADGKWSAVARVADGDELRTVAVDADGAFWASGGKTVYRLREGAPERTPREDECAGWFVYLYEASSQNDQTYTYPTTRKALASFGEASSLGLVEYGGYPRHVGVTVTSKTQGEAVVAHVKSTMKNEDPKLVCFTPKKNARKIPLN